MNISIKKARVGLVLFFAVWLGVTAIVMAIAFGKANSAVQDMPASIQSEMRGEIFLESAISSGLVTAEVFCVIALIAMLLGIISTLSFDKAAAVKVLGSIGGVILLFLIGRLISSGFVVEGVSMELSQVRMLSAGVITFYSMLAIAIVALFSSIFISFVQGN